MWGVQNIGLHVTLHASTGIGLVWSLNAIFMQFGGNDRMVRGWISQFEIDETCIGASA